MVEVKKSQKKLSDGDGDKLLLVDRQAQIQQFNELTNNLTQQTPSQLKSLLEWHGGPGIGKTTLVALLQRECQRHNIDYTIINFKERRKKLHRCEQEPDFLLAELVSQFIDQDQVPKESYHKWKNSIEAFKIAASQLENPIQAYFRLSRQERLYEQPEWLRRWRDVIASFIELVRATTDQNDGSIQPLLFFFDETEDATPILINWIEEWIINPILRLQGCAVVWTARQPWRWKRPEVRQKLFSQQLQPFSPENVQEQLEVGDIDLAQELFGRVFQITEGHPYAGNLAVQQIHQWQVDGESISADYIWDRRAALLQEIFEKFIEEYAFSKLTKDKNKKIERKLKIALRLVALVRIFDNKMLQSLLKNHGGKQFVNISIEDTQELLMRLKRTQLLVWEKGHSLDSNLRHLIRNYYLTNEPRKFKAVNKTALAMNQSWLDKPVDNMNLFVIEELYHLASLLEAGQRINIKDAFKSRLNDYDSRWEDSEVRQAALRRLEGDLEADKELDQLLGGLSKSKLVKIVQDKIKL